MASVVEPDDSRPLPPAPGVAASRSEATERSYLRRALWFAQHAAERLGLEEAGPLEVCHFALERRAEWSKSTWRQTKAALLYRYGSMGTVDAAEAVRLLREQGDQSACLTKTLKTSGRRAKKVSDSDLRETIRRVRASNSAYSAMLESWLVMGSLCGLRPHEWTQADVIWAAPSAVDPLGAGSLNARMLDLDRPYLRVLNAKTSNGRALGNYRHLDLSGMAPSVLEAIDRFCVAMRRVMENGDYESSYESCKKLLFRINSSYQFDPSRVGRPPLEGPRKWIQIYTSRHMFSSKAKEVMQRNEVAALMGHGTDRTAQSHYGRRSNAGGGVGLIPVASEVAKVRVQRKAYAERVARATKEAAPSNAAGPASPTSGSME